VSVSLTTRVMGRIMIMTVTAIAIVSVTATVITIVSVSVIVVVIACLMRTLTSNIPEGVIGAVTVVEVKYPLYPNTHLAS